MRSLGKKIRHVKWIAAHMFVFVFGLRAFAPIYRALAVFALHGLGYSNNYSHAYSGERWFIQRILRREHKGAILDIGANVGSYSKLLSENLEGNVYAFEPLDSSYTELKKLEGAQLHTFKYAISNTDGEAIMYSRGTSGKARHFITIW